MSGKKVILMVEDNPDDEELIRMALEKGKITNEIVVARDGQEALDRLFGGAGPVKKLKFLPTVVLLDLHLPKVDGLEVLKRIRASEETRLLPVVILTSSDEDKDRIRGYGLGANSYVCKPVDFMAFLDAVQELGLYWLILNRPPAP